MIESEAYAVSAAAVDDARAFCRIDGEGEDAVLAALIAAGLAACEAYIGMPPVVRAYRERLPMRGCWQRLGTYPVRAIGGVSAVEDGIVGAALAGSAYVGRYRCVRSWAGAGERAAGRAGDRSGLQCGAGRGLGVVPRVAALRRVASCRGGDGGARRARPARAGDRAVAALSCDAAGMSADEAVRLALAESAVFAGLETRAAVLPRLTIEVVESRDWGTKTEMGREIVLRTNLRVAAGQETRLAGLMADAEGAGVALAGNLSGWRVASAVAVRSRRTVEKDGARLGVVEHRVRVLGDG
jgi:uncharacterized phiE125 gp8 family phage protein